MHAEVDILSPADQQAAAAADGGSGGPAEGSHCPDGQAVTGGRQPFVPLAGHWCRALSLMARDTLHSARQ